MRARRRTFQILETANPGDRASRVVDTALAALILLNVAALILESVEEYDRRFGHLFDAFEGVSLAIFTVEYLLRLWACRENERFASPVLGRLRYALTPQALVDLLAVLPFYLGFDARFVRILRLLKLARYVAALRLFRRVVYRKRAELGVTLLIIGILLVFSSCVIYLVEHEHNPEFQSIPEAMWWSVVTLTTVGYGDKAPVTELGRAIAGLVAVLGIGMFALPTSILGAAFLEELEEKHNPKRCPHCGERL